MATFVNDLRLTELATGEGSGTWGTTTNTNLELIAESFSFGTEAITTNADTHTTTIADGSTDPGRSLFLKYTGTLDSACTITIGPNTVSKLWLIENATSGSQNIIIKQGSGATITIPNGQTKAIYSDGAGSGGAMVDAFQDLSIPDLFIDDDLTVGDDLTVTGLATIGETLAVTGVLTANAGVVVDNITIDGTEIDLSSGDLTIDVAGDIILDAGGAQLRFHDDGTDIGVISNESNNLIIKPQVSDADLIFKGNDGGATITALTLDMSDAGAAIFNGHGTFNDTVTINSTSSGALTIAGTGGGINFTGGNNRVNFTSNRALEGATDGSTLTVGEDYTTIRLSGAVVANESGADADFRVESDGNTHMLFVDAGSDHVNIGTSTDYDAVLNVQSTDNGKTLSLVSTDTDANAGPVLALTRQSSSSAADGDILGRIDFEGLNDANQQVAYGRIQTFIRDASDGTEDGTVQINHFIAGSEVNALELDNDEYVFNNGSNDVDFRVESDGNANMLLVDGGNDRIQVGGTTDLSGAQMNVIGSAGAFNQVSIGASTNNSLSLGNHTTSDVVSNLITASSKFGGLIQGGTNGSLTIGIRDNDVTDGFFVISGAGDQQSNDYSRLRLSVTPSTFVINETGDDADFRVESDNSTHAFFIDGTNAGVGFGTSLNSDLHTSATNILLGRAGSLYAERSSALGIPVTAIGYNFYIDSDTGNYAARITDGGSNLAMGDGTFSFNTAASVSAGAAITYVSRMNIGTTSVVINESGADNDFRVESVSNVEALVVDAAGEFTSVGQNTYSSPGNGNNGTGWASTTAGRMWASASADHGFNRTTDGVVLSLRSGGVEKGKISISGSTTTYATSSDQRLKDNIVDAPSASDDIDAIQVRSFDWKADGSHQKYGMVAQELQSVAPEAVIGDAESEDMMGVDYSTLVPMLIKEIQSLRNRVAELEGE